MLNEYKHPVQKQMAVELFSVLSKIIKRHPEITFIESLHVDEMIESAIKLYSEVKLDFFYDDHCILTFY